MRRLAIASMRLVRAGLLLAGLAICLAVALTVAGPSILGLLGADNAPGGPGTGVTDGGPALLAPAEPAPSPSASAPSQGRMQSASQVRSQNPPGAADEPAGRPVRAIRPDAFAPPFADRTVRYERVAPRAPLSPAAPPPDPVEPDALLARPVVVDAGTIAFGDTRVRLAGIKAPTRGQTCRARAGGRWPCGAMARTALAAYLRGRSLRCEDAAAGPATTVETRCTLAGDDVARWLVANGWAEARPGSGLERLEQEARGDGRGLFGADPRRP